MSDGFTSFKLGDQTGLRNTMRQDSSNAVSTLKEPKKEYLSYIHAFRGLAILQIVFLHSFFLIYTMYFMGARPAEIQIANLIVDLLFHDTTVYFAVISGILFSSVLSRWQPQKYYISRFKFVILPYVVVSIVATAYVLDSSGQFRLHSHSFVDNIFNLSQNILGGDARFHLWYVPVFVCMLALTPLFTILQRRCLPVAICLVVIAPILSSRAGADFTMNNVVHFSGAYVLGLLIGSNPQHFLKISRSWTNAIIAVAVLSAILIVASALFSADWAYERLFYALRIAMTLLTLILLEWLYRTRSVNALIDRFAQNAFGIYLLHVLCLEVVIAIAMSLMPPPVSPLFGVMLSLIVFVAGAALTLGLISLFQAVLGKRSKMLIGA